MSDTILSGFDRLEIKQLRILQALLRKLNVSHAADEIGMTQQGVSEQLRKMRDIFKDQLFVRKSNGLVPTPFAKHLGKKIDSLLREFEGLLEHDVFTPSSAEGTYVISATDYVQQAILSHFLAKIRLKAPKLRIIIENFDSENIYHSMADGQINLVIGSSDNQPTNILSKRLFTEKFVCIGSSSIIEKGRALTVDDLSGYPHIGISNAISDTNNQLKKLFAQCGKKVDEVIIVPCFSVAHKFLEIEPSISFVPSRFATDNGLETIDVETYLDQITFDVNASWHARLKDDPLHQWMLSELIDSISD